MRKAFQVFLLEMLHFFKMDSNGVHFPLNYEDDPPAGRINIALPPLRYFSLYFCLLLESCKISSEPLFFSWTEFTFLGGTQTTAPEGDYTLSSGHFKGPAPDRLFSNHS